MKIEKNSNIICFDSTDIAKFRKITLDVLERSLSLEDNDNGIGTLAEKQMHAVIKKFICADESKHEIKIQGSHGYIGSDNENKNRKFVADVLDGNTIYEIQTGSFRPLADKLEWILKNTTYDIVLVHPIPEILYVSLINGDGSISARKRSPAAKKISSLLSELYYLREILPNDRLRIIGLMIEADSYKKVQPTRNKRRVKTKKYELIPTNLRKAYIFSKPEDYKMFLSDSLPDTFTTAMFSKETKIRGIDAYSAIKALASLGLVEECGNIGRARAYKRK